MFKIEAGRGYMMPAHFGPRYIGPGTSGWYHDVTAMTVPFLTDREKLSALLPPRFSVAEEAIVSVYFVCNKRVDWLAGRGYNMIGVNASVVYTGETERLEGSYSLVIWENLADPILTGREVQGIPKIFADMPDHSINSGVWRANASHYGHPIIDLEISGLRAPELEEIAAAHEAQKGRDNPMSWRFISPTALGESGLDEYLTFPSENKISKIQVGEGKLNWNTLTWEQNPTQFHIVNTLAALPILEYRPAMVTHGAANLALPDRPTRVLR
jgi:acetoacetate decarboxylase